MGQWANLPVDLLKAIEGHLVLYADKIRIRAICMDWNFDLPKLPNYQVKQLPWLLHLLENDLEASHGLFNPIDKKVYNIYLPEARGKVFKGSAYGWLATVEDMPSNSPDIYLINPFTRARIKLPPRNTFDDVVQFRPNQVDEEYSICSNDFQQSNSDEVESLYEYIFDSYSVNVDLIMKVVLSSAPSDECLVVAIYGRCMQLAWCRINDDKWTHIYASIGNIIDIIFYKGKLHALTYGGELFAFENIGTDLDTKVTEILSGIPIPFKKTAYLAECSDGSLIVVGRNFKVDCSAKSPFETIGFTVHKIDLLNSSWIEIKSIGDDIFVLGFNSSLSISSYQLPGHEGNHIYFSDSMDEKEISYYLDVGVFNLNDGTLELLLDFSPPMWPRPIWVNVG
ncbi:hypothetical protein LguiA_013960 [Lonicera macranthoides]